MTAVSLRDRAAEAWAMMARKDNPMPPGVALDYVQEVCDDRDACRCELYAAAGAALKATVPDAMPSDFQKAAHEVTRLVSGGALLLATDETKRIRKQADHYMESKWHYTEAMIECGRLGQRWALSAALTISRVRQLADTP